MCARSTKSRQKYHGKQNRTCKNSPPVAFPVKSGYMQNKNRKARVKKRRCQSFPWQKVEPFRTRDEWLGITIIGRKCLKFFERSFYTRTRVKFAILCFASRLKGMQHREHYALSFHPRLSTFFLTFNHFQLYKNWSATVSYFHPLEIVSKSPTDRRTRVFTTVYLAHVALSVIIKKRNRDRLLVSLGSINSRSISEKRNVLWLKRVTEVSDYFRSTTIKDDFERRNFSSL